MVLNRTLIDRTTDKQMSKKAAGTYFAQLQSKQAATTSEMEALLASHLIPAGSVWSNYHPELF